ncbi:Ser/Thr protein phosphatase family protein, partial [human gut metagenome]
FVEDDISGNYTKMLENIPSNTDVLITHQPPYLIMDESAGLHYGSRTLLDAVKRIKPEAHLFGHIHNAYGMSECRTVLFSNASIVTENYEFCNQPNMINL